MPLLVKDYLESVSNDTKILTYTSTYPDFTPTETLMDKNEYCELFGEEEVVSVAYIKKDVIAIYSLPTETY